MTCFLVLFIAFAAFVLGFTARDFWRALVNLFRASIFFDDDVRSHLYADWVKLSLLTNARPDELIRLRRCDIYREGDNLPEAYSFPSLNGCWVYIPPGQSNEGPRRFIILNKTCQRLLAHYLDSAKSDDSPVFPKP